MDGIRSKVIAIMVLAACAAFGAWVGLGNGKATVREVGAINAPSQSDRSTWQFSSSVGTAAASPLERARIAIGGPLALAASETIYFLTLKDKAGDQLDSSCTYVISGEAFEARWWSVAIYDGATQAYIPNADNRSSWNSVALGQDDAGAWQIIVSPNRPNLGAWLPSHTEGSQPFELLLRLYNPSDETRATALNIALPIVEKRSC